MSSVSVAGEVSHGDEIVSTCSDILRHAKAPKGSECVLIPRADDFLDASWQTFCALIFSRQLNVHSKYFCLLSILPERCFYLLCLKIFSSLYSFVDDINIHDINTHDINTHDSSTSPLQLFLLLAILRFTLGVSGMVWIRLVASPLHLRGPLFSSNRLLQATSQRRPNPNPDPNPNPSLLQAPSLVIVSLKTCGRSWILSRFL